MTWFCHLRACVWHGVFVVHSAWRGNGLESLHVPYKVAAVVFIVG